MKDILIRRLHLTELEFDRLESLVDDLDICINHVDDVDNETRKVHLAGSVYMKDLDTLRRLIQLNAKPGRKA